MKYEIIVKGINKVRELNRNLKKVHENSKKINSSVGKLRKKIENTFGVSGVMDRFRNGIGKTKTIFNSVKNKAFELGKGLKSAGKAGKAAFGIIKGNGGGLIKALTGGMKIFRQSAGFSFATATAGATAFAASIIYIVAPILAVIGAIALMKKMFTLNVGGMQSQWGRVMGKMKAWWGKFSVDLNNSLRKLAPLIKAVIKTFEISFNSLKPFFKVMVDGFKIIKDGIKPIIDDYLKMTNTLNESKTEFSSIVMLGKALGYVFKTLAKIFVFWIKLQFAIVKMTNKIMSAFEVLGKFINGVFAPMLEYIWGIVQKIINGINTVSSFLGKSTEQNQQSEAIQSSKITNQKTINNQQQISFHSNREVSANNGDAIANSIVNMITQRG